MGKFIDLTGQKFERLIVIKRVENNKFNQTQWLCKCDCGNNVIVTTNSLKSKNTKSCGCLKKEQDKINIAKKIHNMSNTRLYNIWKHMKNRCNCSTNKRHKFYYDKGIKVCQEWENDFINFYNWAMQNGYKEDLTIDRIDNNKGYSPENCRWANYIQQNNNQSNNIKIEYKNKQYTLKELSRQYNIKRCTLYDRLKRGWNIERILNTPVIKKEK